MLRYALHSCSRTRHSTGRGIFTSGIGPETTSRFNDKFHTRISHDNGHQAIVLQRAELVAGALRNPPQYQPAEVGYRPCTSVARVHDEHPGESQTAECRWGR